MTKARQLAEIDCDAPAHGAIASVLNARLEEMCALRDLALDWSDPEGVHNMRVASRRLRGALGDFMPYLRKRKLAACLEQIKAIAQALGSVRDYDVEILTLETIATKAPTEFATGITRFAAFSRASRAEARVKLMLPLESQSLQELRTKFAAAVEEGAPPKRGKPKQKISAITPTYREVAQLVILSRLEALEQFSDSLYQPLRIKPLHKMRIAAKHLRYALELFEHCWGSPLLAVGKRVAALQSSLGKLHDCDVWIERFGHAATHQVPDLDFDYKATAVWLLRHFLKVRGKHVGNGLGQWSDWEAEAVSTQLRQTILSDSSAVDQSHFKPECHSPSNRITQPQ